VRLSFLRPGYSCAPAAFLLTYLSYHDAASAPATCNDPGFLPTGAGALYHLLFGRAVRRGGLDGYATDIMRGGVASVPGDMVFEHGEWHCRCHYTDLGWHVGQHG